MIKLLDTVALTEDLPEHGLVRGQVGTVVETLAEDVFEVEFKGDEGQTYAMLELPAHALMVLHHEFLRAFVAGARRPFGCARAARSDRS